LACNFNHEKCGCSTVINNFSESESKSDLIIYWKDYFTDKEKIKLVSWVNKVAKATESTLGFYPFDVHIYLSRRGSANEPVPWAHTQRDSFQCLYFYVNPDYSLEEFLNDWTAPHEFSHLSIPFLGNENAWFAEGYASFMQYQIMETLGIYTGDEIQQKYLEKINNIKSHYYTTNNLVSVAQNLRREYKFPEMYWGSATYFFRLDKILEERGSSLIHVIQEYLKCCRHRDDSIEDVIQSWDEIIGDTPASNLFNSYNSSPAYKMIELNSD
jgi:hypothetical protein